MPRPGNYGMMDWSRARVGTFSCFDQKKVGLFRQALIEIGKKAKRKKKAKKKRK